MQVSIACTEHNLKNRNGEDRLISKQNTTTPNSVNAARAKFRTVAIIARSLGTFTPQHHISLKESTAKQTGMKYRYGKTLYSHCFSDLSHSPPHPPRCERLSANQPGNLCINPTSKFLESKKWMQQEKFDAFRKSLQSYLGFSLFFFFFLLQSPLYSVF